MSRKTRAVFKCKSIEKTEHNMLAKFETEYAGGKFKDFTEFTPWGSIEIGITLEAKAAETMKVGSFYYVDFSEVSQAELEAQE